MTLQTSLPQIAFGTLQLPTIMHKPCGEIPCPTNGWQGPDPVLIWGKGHACIYDSRAQNTRWLPDHLIKPYNSSREEKPWESLSFSIFHMATWIITFTLASLAVVRAGFNQPTDRQTFRNGIYGKPCQSCRGNHNRSLIFSGGSSFTVDCGN